MSDNPTCPQFPARPPHGGEPFIVPPAPRRRPGLPVLSVNGHAPDGHGDLALTYIDGAEYAAGYGDPPGPALLFRQGDEVVAVVDATPLLRDGMVSSVEVSGGNLVVTFNTDAGREPVEIPLTDIFDPDDYYDKTAADGRFALKGEMSVAAGTGADADKTTITLRPGVLATVLNAHQPLDAYFNAAEYDSASRKILLKHGTTVKAQIDATAFIKDGMVSSVAISNGKLVITFNTDAGLEPIEIPLTDIFDPENYYDKTAVDTLLSYKAEKAANATAGNLAALDANGDLADSGLPEDEVESLLFPQYYPDGSVKSVAEFTAGIKYDAPDMVDRTITVKPFCNTGTVANDNSPLVGRVVIPPFVDAQGNPYISDNGTRYKVVGVGGGPSVDYNRNLTAIVAPNTMTNIGNSAFDHCAALSSVSLPAARDIGDNAFSGCTALSSVSLPAATGIGNHALGGCTKLTSVDFGDIPRSTVPSLGDVAFSSVPTSCKIIVPDLQYDAWTVASGWSNLVMAGYKFLRHSEWEYARRYELAAKQDTVSDLAAIRSGAAAGATAYQKPSGGIPASDLASAVRTSLGKADTALQAQDITGKADKVANAIDGNLAALTAVGDLVDSGKKAEDFAAASHTHTASAVTDLGDAATMNVGTTSGTVAAGDDSRLADARTPTAHKSSHATGGSDAIAPSDIGAAASSHTHAASDITSGLATVATTGSYNDLTNKPTIPTVPTKVSAFTNDAGYLTSHQDITGKADKVVNAVSGNLAALDANGNLTDSGKKASDFAADDSVLKLTGGSLTGDLEVGDVYNSANLMVRGTATIEGTVYAPMLELQPMMGEYFDIAYVNGAWVLRLTHNNGSTDIVLPFANGTAALLHNLAPDFSTSDTYAEGDLCVYENALYRCTTAVTSAGSWTGSTNWAEATVEDVLAALRTAVGNKVAANAAITGATKCKITYDSKGLVTAGADLEATDIPTITTAKLSDFDAAIRYAMPASVALVAESDAATLVCADRAVTNATIADGFSTLNLTFPTAVSGKVRDFYLRITVAAGESAPALSIPQGITIENPDGAVPEIADGETSAASTTLVWFSETASNVFTAKSETVKAVA